MPEVHHPSAERGSPIDRWLGWLVGLVIGLGAIGTVLLVIPSGMFDLDRFSVVKELTLLVTALVVGLVVLARSGRIELGVAELCLVGFLIVSAISAAAATNRWISFRSLAITLAGTAVFFGARFAATRAGRGVVVGGVVLAVIAGSVSGLLQAYGWNWPLLADTRAPGGTLGNRNFMAHLTVIGLPLAGWIAARARTRLGALLGVGAMAIMTGAIVLSRSRAAWVGLGCVAAGILLIGLVTRSPTVRVGRRRALGMAVGMGIGAAAALVVPNQLDWKSRSPYRDSLRDVLNYREGSGRGRLIQYRNSLALVARDPLLGVGPGNWMVAYPLVTTRGDPSFDANDPIPTNPWPSSDWVALLAERGPVASLAWLGFLASLALVALRRAADPDHGTAALAAFGVMTAVAVQGLFDAVVLLAPPTLIGMASLGALLPATRPIRAVELTGRRLRWLFWFGLVVGALALKSAGQVEAILTAADGWSTPNLVRAVRTDPGNYRLHLAIAQRAGCGTARPHAAAAARQLPYHPIPPRLVARCR